LSQGDSLGVSPDLATPGASWCSAATGRRPVGGIVSSLLNRPYTSIAPLITQQA